MQQTYLRIPTWKCDFNKVAMLCNFIEITLQHECYPANLLHIFRTAFPMNNSERLLLPRLYFNRISMDSSMKNKSKNGIIDCYDLLLIEVVVQRCSVKKLLLEISQNSQDNNCARILFQFLEFISEPQACNFIKKETLTQVIYCEFCEISKNIFFHRTPLVAASVFTIEKCIRERIHYSIYQILKLINYCKSKTIMEIANVIEINIF